MSDSHAYDAYKPEEYKKITYATNQMWCLKCNVKTINMITGEIHHEFVWVGKDVRCTRCGEIPVNPAERNTLWENVGFSDDLDNINVKIYNDLEEAKRKAGL